MSAKLLGKYIFSRDGKCLFSLNKDEDDEKHKLVYGFLQTIISFISHFNDNTEFITYSTETYQFSVQSLVTGYKIVLITENLNKPKEFYKKLMKHFYKDIYVEFVVKNPVIRPGEEITSDLFRDQVLGYYSTAAVR